MKPRALDLFCGAGGAGMGLHKAGFDVVGVDIEPQRRYPFEFVQADALRPPFDLREYDFIWASPPCQAYSVASRGHRAAGKVYPDLIEPTRALLKSSGIHYAIENVVGAPLENAVQLCGTMFGLKVFRHRLFELSFFMMSPQCSHAGKRIGTEYFSVAGGSGRWSNWNGAQYGISKGTIAQWRAAMGIDWMIRREITQAIPPAYSEFIGRAAIEQLTKNTLRADQARAASPSVPQTITD